MRPIPIQLEPPRLNTPAADRYVCRIFAFNSISVVPRFRIAAGENESVVRETGQIMIPRHRR